MDDVVCQRDLDKRRPSSSSSDRDLPKTRNSTGIKKVKGMDLYRWGGVRDLASRVGGGKREGKGPPQGGVRA